MTAARPASHVVRAGDCAGASSPSPARQRPSLPSYVLHFCRHFFRRVAGSAEDLILVEVVDDRDEPVEPGARVHKVLITNLINQVQPLIRYERSDSVTLAAGTDPTGMPFRRLTTRSWGTRTGCLRLQVGDDGEMI